MARYIVTNLNDSGAGSLRQALNDANSTVGVADEIVFDASLSGGTLSMMLSGFALADDVVINGDIDGDRKADITISGANASGNFIRTATAGTESTLKSLNLVDFSNDIAVGGTISFSNSELTLLDSTISGSSSGFRGGAISLSPNATLNVVGSVIEGSSAAGNGGAISVASTSTANIINSTLFGNSSDAFGGGINSQGTLNVFNSTISRNVADADGSNNGVLYGGGISTSGTTTIYNSILDANFSSFDQVASDVRGVIDTASNSYFNSNFNSFTITNSTDNIIGSGSLGGQLGALADNGGPVQTMAIPFPFSPLVNAGDPALIPPDFTDYDSDMNKVERVPVDGNGLARVQGRLDIGAVEYRGDLVVDTLVDEDDGDYSPGNLSLREALSFSDARTITFAKELAGGTIELNGSQLDINKSIIIDGDVDGDDKADITISGFNPNGSSRIFGVANDDAGVVLKSLELTNGDSGNLNGGAIYFSSGTGSGTLELYDVMLTSNHAARGGAVFVFGLDYLEMNNVAALNNTSDQFGGAIFSSGGSVYASNTTIDGNKSDTQGGGLFIFNSEVDLINSTITNNFADVDGTNEFDGGGVYIFDAVSDVSIYNSVIAQNTSGGGVHASDVDGTIDNASNNFFGQTVTTAAGTITGMGDPLLSNLGNYGGTVSSRLPTAGSALIDAGNDTLASSQHDYDVNGNLRLGDANVDIGAAEYALTVTTLDDEAAGASLAADIADGNGLSLREAIEHNVADGIIRFDGSLKGGTLTLNNPGPLFITKGVTIDGDVDNDDMADITISGNDTTRLFTFSGLSSPFNATLKSLNLIDGYAASSGGILGFFQVDLTILNSTLSGGNSDFGGGAISVGSNSNLFLGNSTLTDNHAGQNGGAINTGNTSTVEVYNSTIVGNTAGQLGGGIFSKNITKVYDSTIVGNHAAVDGISSAAGGGIDSAPVPGDQLEIYNSVIAQNLSGSAAHLNDIGGTVEVARNSFFGTTTPVTTSENNIDNGGDPLLGELLDNGGTVLTMSPLDGSPLIGAGSATHSAPDIFDLDRDSNTAESVPVDARGLSRTVGQERDIGAVEHRSDEYIGAVAEGSNVVGGVGDDILRGGIGDDAFDGGSGTDTVDYSNATAAVTVRLDLGTATGAGNDTFTDVENIQGSSLADIIYGSNVTTLVNTIHGGDGADKIYGGRGTDLIDGGGGADLLHGDGEKDLIFGGADNDRIYGKFADDILYGGDGADLVVGDAANDTLYGDDGNDRLYGGTGNDIMYGGAGADLYDGSSGDDIFKSSAGADRLNGRAGIDTFEFEQGNDNDRIFLFEDNIDKIEISTAFGFTDANDLITNHSRAVGNTLYIDLDPAGGDYVQVVNWLATHTAADLVDDIGFF